MTGARQALRGWRRLEPPRSRLPLPWAVVARTANWLFANQLREEAILVLAMFVTYMRPSEPFKLLARHIVPPCPTAGLGHRHWALTLHPLEGGEGSKTHEFDESILLDTMEGAALGRALHTLGRQRLPHSLLFTTTQGALGRSFHRACTGLGLGALGCPTLYQLRHAGASWDFASGRRTLPEVQRRGRWRAPISVRRYEKKEAE